MGSTVYVSACIKRCFECSVRLLLTSSGRSVERESACVRGDWWPICLRWGLKRGIGGGLPQLCVSGMLERLYESRRGRGVEFIGVRHSAILMYCSVSAYVDRKHSCTVEKDITALRSRSLSPPHSPFPHTHVCIHAFPASLCVL